MPLLPPPTVSWQILNSSEVKTRSSAEGTKNGNSEAPHSASEALNQSYPADLQSLLLNYVSSVSIYLAGKSVRRKKKRRRRRRREKVIRRIPKNATSVLRSYHYRLLMENNTGL